MLRKLDGVYDLIAVAAPSASAALEAWLKTREGRKHQKLESQEILNFLMALTYEEVRKTSASIALLSEELKARRLFEERTVASRVH